MEDNNPDKSPFLEKADRLSGQLKGIVLDKKKQAVFVIAVEDDGDKVRTVASAAFNDWLLKKGLVNLFKLSIGPSIEPVIAQAIIEYKTWKLVQIMNVSNLINTSQNDEQHNN